MNHCPPELHSYICSLACTDDGFTARSLSLVSKYFAQVTLPYLYQSLSVSGSFQLSALARRLKNAPVHHRLIHHLYLSDTDTDSDHRDQALLLNLFTILTLAAPTLESLTFVALSPTTSTSLISRLFRIPFPRLHDLTIAGYYPFPSAPSSFPLLERLHLLGNRNPYGLLHLGALESCMPALTHLCISGLALATSFSQELSDAFSASSDSGDDDEGCIFSAELPSKLQHLVVQCGPEPSSCRTSQAARLKDQLMLKNLENLQQRLSVEKHRTRFSVLPRSFTDILPEDMRKQWMNRLRGEEGIWECA